MNVKSLTRKEHDRFYLMISDFLSNKKVPLLEKIKMKFGLPHKMLVDHLWFKCERCSTNAISILIKNSFEPFFSCNSCKCEIKHFIDYSLSNKTKSKISDIYKTGVILLYFVLSKKLKKKSKKYSNTLMGG